MRSVVLWLLVIVAAAAVGAVVTLSPAFLAVVVVLLVIIATMAYPQSVWPFVALTTIIISPSIFLVDGEPSPNGDGAQKLILIVAALCLIISLGLRWSRLGAAAITVVGLAGLVSIFNIGGQIEVGSDLIVRAVIGYCLPWLFLFVDWRSLSLSRGLGYLVRLPLLCLIAGVLLQVTGVRPPSDQQPLPGVFAVDTTIGEGVSRLQGASIPAHLAMLALIGLASGMCLLVLSRTGRDSRAYLWIALNFVILLGTATRGPIVVGVLLVLTFAVHTLLLKRSLSVRARRAAWLIAATAVVSFAIAAPDLIKRSVGNSYEGTFNTSGRDQAWEFFLGFASQSPLTGKGLGFAPIAVKLYVPLHVQKDFKAPHNEYIHLWVDGGVLFAIGLGIAVLAAFFVAARAHSGTVRYLVAVFALGMVGYSYVDNTFSTPQFTVLLLIFLGLLAAHPSNRTQLSGDDDSALEMHSDSALEMHSCGPMTPVLINRD